MARRRGFWAELQHQAAVAERDRQRALAAHERDLQRRLRESQRAAAAAERAHVAAERQSQRERVAAEREAKRLHAEAKLAEVDSLNASLASDLAEIDGVLEATLMVDDHVDLEGLRREIDFPAFNSSLEEPIQRPEPPAEPAQPTYEAPARPTGLGAMFGKKKHAAETAAAEAAYESEMAAWRDELSLLPDRQRQLDEQHAADEAARLSQLAEARDAYNAELAAHQSEVEDHNAQLARFIDDYQAGRDYAVEEYFSVVFGNSVYPAALNVGVEQTYVATDKELTIELHLPAPTDLPAARSYKYVKARDEIDEAAQTQKEQRERYNSLVEQIVLRTLHEAWESDRQGHVDTIALTGGVDHVDPATGRETTTPLVAAAVDRATFEELDLANVTPSETLKHLSAVVSKNAFALAPIALSDGVRR